MSTRLQVVVDEAELGRFRRAARRSGVTLSQWVRDVLRRAESAEDVGDASAKLDAIRSAAAHTFPAPDVDEMLAEIESGYLADPGPR